MFIEKDEIKDWQDLQNKVRDFFIELGYEARTAETVPLANGGQAEVDVYAVKGHTALAQKILIECKFWDTNVPRANVQSFTMDVQEAGANFGLFISKEGFQAGAYKGIPLTTVKLLTFEELQKTFADEWFDYNVKPLDELCEELFDDIGELKNSSFYTRAFSNTLQAMHAGLEATIWTVTIYKSFRPDTALWRVPQPIEAPIVHPGFPKISCYDARSFVRSFRPLLEDGLRAWDEYGTAFTNEVMSLDDVQRMELFESWLLEAKGGNPPDVPK